ncbi:MAG: hypothetical protein U5K00_01220 [Melioribacteraceae bacterium]|nr:hypothetical protein [Melioribacteraceae bacterium]
MQNLSKLSKTFLYLTVASFSIFIGSYIVKLAMMNQLFEPENLLLKNKFSGTDLNVTFEIMIPVFSITNFSFLLLTISYIVFLATSKTNLKKHGWLFIITIILFITAVFEWILIIKFDIKILTELMNNEIEQSTLVESFKKE